MNWIVRGSLVLGVLGVMVTALWPAAALAARVTGTVVDPAGRPVEYAILTVTLLKRGVVADQQGRFALELPAGPHAIEVSQVGYATRRLTVEAGDAMPALSITLDEAPIPLSEVSVSASSFGQVGKAEGAVLRTIDVYTTPGAAADVFQAIRTLPGINAPAEGAALFVRGGDPNETLVRLDGGELGHPYHAEGASGGLFSALDTYMIESAFFSSGGFSARYGGVLSGVLDIRSKDPMDLKTVSVSAHMAGASVSSAWALKPGRLSFIGSMSRSNPSLLFKVYGTAGDFQSSPTGSNGFGRLLWRYSDAGRLSFSGFDARDQVGVRVEILNSALLLNQSASNQVASINLDDVVGGKVALRAQAAWQRYDNSWTMGEFGSEERERHLQANADAVWPISDRHELTFGGNIRHRDTEIEGRFPADSTDFLPGAPTRLQRAHPVIDYPGVFVEDKMRIVGPLYATLGARVDWASEPGVWTADPRAALAWKIDDHQTVRVAAGRYHQLAQASQLDPIYGNPDLEPLHADHVIAGYEWMSDYGTVRLEGYRKDYRNLVINDTDRFYTNGGHGYARGVDAFVQGTLGWISGWVSYGWLDSRRKELDHPTEVPSAYGVDHAVTLVGKYKLTSNWEMGGKFSWSTGRPYTPVVGRSYDPGRAIWHPIYGEHQSENMPDYRRLDLRATRLFSLPAGAGLPESSVCVFFVEALNVLGIRNTLDYVYSEDYGDRRAIESYFSRRMAVVGCALSW